MSNNGKYKGFDENIKSQLNESSKTLIGAPITTGLDTAYAINAPEINWAGYKLYDEDLTSTGHMLSYIETQLDSKATSSGEIWDDIKDNEYITSQINIYASYTSNKIAPDIVWVNPTDNDINTYSSLPSSSSDAEGWYTSTDVIPGSNKYVWMSSIYIVKSLSNNILGYRGPSSTPIYLPSESGINGNFKSTVFCRTNETPKTPSDGAVYNTGVPTTTQVYKESNNEPITGVEWSDGIPSGQEILWASTGIIKDSSPETTVWTTPRQMTDTATYDVEFAKKQTNDDTPPTPNASNSGTNPSGTKIWYDPTNDANEDFTQMYWRAERECINGEWGDWVIVRIKGEQGTAGVKGDFKSTVFKRSENQPETPSGGDYDHPVPSGWYDGIPNETGPVWSSWRTFSADGNNSNWTTPTLVADTPTYDVEFSPNEAKPKDPSTTPSVWIDPTTNHYKDHTAQNPHIYEGSWSDMIWRAERNRATSQDPWSEWVITKIKGEDGKVNASLPYHEQRWACFDESENVEAPDNIDTVGEDDDTWKLSFQYEPEKYTWMTTRPVIYDIEDNVQTAKYVTGSTWSTPIRITPKDGINGEANPIQPVLKYTWYNHFDDGENYPAYLASEANPNQTSQGKTNVEWHESPGNPSGDNKYLWMIQGERFNGNMRLWDTDGDPNTNEAYWTSPVCLSGKDGEPGADGDDIEFIYKRFSSAHDFTNDNPSSWYTTGSIDKPIEEWTREGDNHTFAYVNDYLGPDGSGWHDNPQGVDSSYKYEYATYRKTHKINGESYWEAFNTPFAWSIYGENGIDGDGVEYIYYTYSSSNVDPVPPIFDLDPNSFQKSEVYGEVEVDSNSYIWHDDPQTLNNDNQKFQWVSTRKYRAITSSNINKLPNTYTLDGSILKYNGNDTAYKAGDKIWFPYSDPELWNWYTENGTDAARILMIYRRNDSGTTAPQLPTAISGSYSIGVGTNSSQTGWAESPGNSDGDSTAYLWMTSAHYTNKTDIKNKGNVVTSHNYILEDSWQTPVCLTGEPGHDGEDGTDIEFIYFRTSEDNIVFDSEWDDFATDGDGTENDYPFTEQIPVEEADDATHDTITTDGVKYLITGYNNFDIITELINSNVVEHGYEIKSSMLHDVWTDNPLGVTSTYDYEYVSIRKKIDGTWQDFCKPFLWSKYGEDGVDGDGVEYIYYLSPDENAVTFDNISQSDNDNSNNPANWSTNQSSEHILNGWSDDPSGVSEEKRWEYVSVRHKRLNNTTGKVEWGKYSEPAVWSHFAVDALATSLVFETDNDMIAVSVDDNSHVTKNATSTARMYLYHDTKLVSTSYYNVNILDSNLDEHNGEIKGYYDDGNVSYSYLKYNDDIIAKVSLSNNTYLMEYNIPQGFDMSSVDDELRITTSAYIFDNSFDSTGHVEVGSERPFVNKVKGLHVDLSDIYQIQTDKNVVKKNPQNELENVTITLKSLTSNSRIDTTSDAVNEHLFVLYKDGININKNTLISYVVEIGTPITLNDKLSVHEFELWYNPSNTYWVNNKLSRPNNVSQVFNGENDILLDEESLSLVWDGTDGKPGTDSKSQEYIYYRSELPVSTWDNAHNPSVWSTHENVIVDRKSYYAYCTDDFPFIAERTSYNNWYDHPQGIDGESYLYEYVSTREYDTSTKEWGTFSEPVAWATWGHSGEDGDGVEYIYYRTSNEYSSWVENEHPANWFKRTGEYQSSEYIHSNATSIWKDNPQGVTSSNKYEYISIRKYKKLSYKDWNNFALTCKTIGSGMTLASNLNRANTNIPVTFTSDEQLYNLRDTIITLLNQNVLYGDTWQLNCGAGSLEILNAVISSITNNEKYWSPYSQPSLWAKYGEKGATGNTGGSGLTFDFDNPSIQIAVNSNGKIKDYQEVTTYLNVYEGASKISAKDITLSIISNGTHDAFEHSYSDTDKYGYTLFNSNSSNNGTSTYYTWKIGDVDIENIGNNNIVQLTENSSIEFNISYKGNDYIKRVSLVPIKYGEDGANAVVFDLYCPTSVIHYNAMDDTPSFNPTTISDIKVRRIENSNVEYFVASNDNEFTIKYKIDLYRNDVYDTTEEDEVDDGTLNINNIINTILSAPDKNYDIPKTVKLSLYHTENDTPVLWDETDLEIIYDGINGTDSFAEEFIYSITYIPNDKDNSGGEDPSTWSVNDSQDFNSRDYIPNNQTSYWKDHPQGVSPEHPIEWMSHRTYNYETKTWNRYEAPVKWSHWGSNGKDGDGVEYIFKRFTALQTWGTSQANPALWSEQQQSEYLGPEGYEWSDDPQGVTDIYSYEYVAVRKYDGDTRLWGKYSTPSLWAKYGQKGDTGNPGADAYVLDWTNDQINLAVDENGYIISGENGQLKGTSININSLNGVFGSSPTITMNWYTSGDEMPYKKFTKNYSDGGSNTISSTTIDAGIQPSSNQQIVFSHGKINSNNNYPLQITVGKDYPGNKAYIPENGIEIKVKVSISGNEKSISNVDKVLRICGQHIPSNGIDGQNAVTYEIVPSTNAINYTTQGNIAISYVVNKYDGNTITQLSSEDFNKSPLYLNASWIPSIGSISYNNTFNGVYYLSGGGSIDLKLWKGQQNSSYAVLLDTETIPVLKNGENGESGTQGFTGPIVRMRGEYNSSNYYSDGAIRTGQSTSSNNYSETDGPRYVDIVIYTNNNVTKYYKCNGHTGWSNGTTQEGITKNTGYCNNRPPTSTLYWTEATQYDFIATKLLYADQALIKQITSHDFIATKTDGTPVAGVTSGSKQYTNSDVTDNNYSGLHSSTFKKNLDTGGTGEDPSNVRIFAGQIWNDNNSYSLTYAPFNVRQDGTAYMSKANIVGDVNIGGTVSIGGQVNIEGNAKVKADVSVNTLTLNSGSFIINSDCNLPNFNVNEHKMFYVLIHKQDSNVCYINPQNNQSILATDTNGNFKNYDPGTSIELQNHGLYTAISTYMNNMSYWIVSKTGVYAVPNARQTYRKIFSKNDIEAEQFIYISKIEILEKKTIKCTFKTNSSSAPSSGKSGFINVQSVFVYCSLNENRYYQVGIRSDNHWIYNSSTPDEILPSRYDDDTSFNISHHYTSGSNSVNGWNNNTNIYVELTWNDPTEQETGYDGLSVDEYRILYYNDTHGWNHNINNVQQDAISGGNYYSSSQPDKFNYYVEIVYYN